MNTKKILLSLTLCVLLTGCGFITDSEDSTPISTQAISSIQNIMVVFGSPYYDGGYGGINQIVPSGNQFLLETSSNTIGNGAYDAKLHNNHIYLTLSKASGSLLKLNQSDYSVISQLALGSYPHNIAIYNNTAYISNNASNTVSVVNLAASPNVITATINMPEDAQLESPGVITTAKPSGLAISNQQVYVALNNLKGFSPEGPGMLVVISPESNAITQRIKLNGTNAQTLHTHSRFPNQLFVIETGTTFPADHSGLLEVVNTQINEVVASANINTDSAKMVIDSTGQLFVASSETGTKLIPITFNGTTLTVGDPIIVKQTTETYVADLAIDSNDNIYILSQNNHKVYIYNTQTESVSEITGLVTNPGALMLR